jgi:hypothetical protein
MGVIKLEQSKKSTKLSKHKLRPEKLEKKIGNIKRNFCHTNNTTVLVVDHKTIEDILS